MQHRGDIVPRTIDEGFRDFLVKLTPSTAETTSAKSHRASVESCLKNNFGMTRFFRTGSFGNGTSISGYSDVDYFAEIPSKNLKQNSSSTLTMVKNALTTRFPNTGVRVTCPTVLVPFGYDKKDSTEIAPCDYRTTDHGFEIYEIADGNGGWLKSCPDAHNAYVSSIDGKHNGKVKKLIRYIKAWKFYQNVSISSFYLELRVAKFCDGESSIFYHYDIKTILANLLSNNLAKMIDPLGISGSISPCETQAKYDDAISKLNTAVVRAEKALNAIQNDNVKDAFDWYNLLYNGDFANYYY